MGFVKLHDKIFQSSIMEEDPVTRLVFLFMIALADRHGNVSGTTRFLARIMNLDHDDVLRSLDVLTSPDPESRSQEEDGRRILRTGVQDWHIVNHTKYRNKEDPEVVAERKRRQREAAKGTTRQTPIETCHGRVTNSRSRSIEQNPPHSPPPMGGDGVCTPTPEKKRNAYTREFEEFWRAYPRKVGKGRAFRAWKAAKKKPNWPGLDELLKILARQREQQQWLKDGGQFIPHPATWLNGDRWEDEVEEDPFDIAWKQSGGA